MWASTQMSDRAVAADTGRPEPSAGGAFRPGAEGGSRPENAQRAEANNGRPNLRLLRSLAWAGMSAVIGVGVAGCSANGTAEATLPTGPQAAQQSAAQVLLADVSPSAAAAVDSLDTVAGSRVQNIAALVDVPEEWPAENQPSGDEAVPLPQPVADDGAGADALLLELVAAQQHIEHVSGRFQQRTVQADDLDAAPSIQNVQFAFQRPDNYFMLYQPAVDPEEKLWFLSDGQTQWKAEQLFEGDPPLVSQKAVDREAWGFHRVIDFFRMDLTDLRQDFEVTARRIDAETAALSGAVVAVDLQPLAADMAEELRAIRVLLDAQHQTRGVIITDGQDNVITIDVQQADYETAPESSLFSWPE